jgi:phosphoenolpyruvate phosphomutase
LTEHPDILKVKAIILSSGVGSRLMPQTKNLPKSLLKINDKTILDIEMENLAACGIRDIIITTGHKHDVMERYATAKYPSSNISLVRNERFDTTNYIYSIWLTRDHVDDDIVILHGDMVFEAKLLERLLNHPSENGALVNNVVEPPEKDFKAVVKNGFIKKIGVDLSGQDAYFCAPIYKFSKAGFSRWLLEIDSFVKAGNVRCYAEEAFNNIAGKIQLKAVYYGDEFCMEIDTRRDLDLAREYYRNLLCANS